MNNKTPFEPVQPPIVPLVYSDKDTAGFSDLFGHEIDIEKHRDLTKKLIENDMSVYDFIELLQKTLSQQELLFLTAQYFNTVIAPLVIETELKKDIKNLLKDFLEK